MPTWDPQAYLTYAADRGRPFVDLLARVGASDPATIVDLGCGPGNQTELLGERWPGARVIGVDSSTEMIARARAQRGRASYEIGDLRRWRPERPADVVVSNATLQWVPDHLDRLGDLVAMLAPGGWLAFQVPRNGDQPSTTLRAELSTEAAYAEHAPAEEIVAWPAAAYLTALQRLDCAVDAWETTYLHVLTGEDPVFAWISGTGLRPTLEALPADLRASYETELRRRLRAAYPDRGHGVVLPFRRVFVVARRA